MQNVSPLLTAHYRDKADHCFNAMKLLAEDVASFRTGIGLLAVHSAISLNDAILVGITGKRGKGEDHQIAVRQLERICNELKMENKKGVQYFSWLLSKKSDIAYGERRIEDPVLMLSMDRAEKFVNWAYTQFKEVLRAAE